MFYENVTPARFQAKLVVGHVAQDLVLENINPPQVQAKIVDLKKTPEYKQEGFFVFSDIREGKYTLKITGQRLQPTILEVVVPAPPKKLEEITLDSRGDNELIVMVRSIENLVGNNGGKKINFDPVILTKEIRAGARVISTAGSSASLIDTLKAGPVSSARIKNANGIAEDSIVRVVRDKSIRMNFDPYYSFDAPITRVVGKVVSKLNPATPLPCAHVSITKINNTAIDKRNIQGVTIVVGVDVSGNEVVLGTEKDTSATTNEKGDYNLYFSNEALASFKITGNTLQELETANVPEEVRKDLETLKDRSFRGLERFLVALKETISNENVSKYRALILEHSEDFIKNLTLEVTLAGFNPDSRFVEIRTGERKPVDDFELVKI